MTVLVDEHTERDELVHHSHHEERIAVRPLMHRARQLRRQGGRVEALPQIGGDIRLAEKFERNVFALSPHPELLEQRPQGMSRDDDVHRAIASEDE